MLLADKALNSHQMPDDVQWDSLFSSPAYDALFKSVRWNKKTFKKNVRRAFQIVFDPARSTLCDSILQLLDTVKLADIKTELPFYISTAYNVRNNLDKYSAMLTSVDMDSVTAKADALAHSLIPAGTAD
ncbi:MAG: hypothetical protein K2M57_08000 [Paramuribaculum sp.]|nr:hypothetical protein [Paramuribaculum sp.]